MKIAVACNGNEVSGHFGHCECFRIFETDERAILKEDEVLNPGHQPGFLPNFLGDKGITVIIAGGMGSGAVEIFHERHIDVVTGASGNARHAVEAYIGGELKTTGAVCQHKHDDEHSHSCGGRCGR